MSDSSAPSDNDESESEDASSEDDDADVLGTALRALRARLSPVPSEDEVDDQPDD